MKIAVIGSTGTIGEAVSNLLRDGGHEVQGVSRNTEPGVNIHKPESIDSFYDQVGRLDALVCAAGTASFGKVSDLSDKQFEMSIRDKLMGQVNLVRKGIPYLREGGVFVLTSGMLSTDPRPGTSAVAMVNAALEGFTRAAALDMGEGKRINIVSPPLIRETAVKMGRDAEPWPTASKVSHAYLEALKEGVNGEVIYVEGYGR